METHIVLVPVDCFDRHEEVEEIENQVFNNFNEVYEIFDNNPEVKIYDLSGFMEGFNDEWISDSHYWLTYVRIK